MELKEKIQKFIAEQRELSKELPFQSDYEEGVKFGANDILDELERLID